MIEIIMRHGPHKLYPVGHRSHAGKKIGKLHSRHLRANWVENPANMIWSHRFRIPHVNVTLTAAGINYYNRLRFSKSRHIATLIAVDAKRT